MKRGRRMLLALLLSAAVVAVLARPGLEALGRFLVVADPPRPSDAIFVLDGATPVRELEAAALYHRGVAPRVVLSRPRTPLADSTWRLAGLPTPQEHAARVLTNLEVPGAAIVRLETVVENTEQELALDFAWARAQGLRRVLLVTSPYHTRRVRVLWNARYERALPALVYPTSWEPFVPERWWRSRRDIEHVVHELAGIAHFYVGSPLPTFDARR